MNERQRNLLKKLVVHTNQIFQIEDLRKSLDCSEKTVRNDLDRLEDFLGLYPAARLVRQRGMGIMLEADEQTQAELFRQLHRVDGGTEEERMIEIAYRLLVHAKPVTLKDLAEKYFVNPAIIKSDFEEIGQWLASFHVTIRTKQRIGTWIEGDEFAKRNALAHLSELVSSHEHRNYVLDFFPEHEVKAVKKILGDTQRLFDFMLTDGRFESLVIHALIMMKRTRQQTPVMISSEDIEETMRTKEYEIAASFLAKLEEMLGLKFPVNEQIYYTWHVGSSIRHADSAKGSTEGRLTRGAAAEMAQKMIGKVQALTQIRFTDDQVLQDGLVIHLEAAVKRISYGFHITNPMLREIKRLYPYLFSMVLFAINDMKEEDLAIPEEEAGYLVLHFQAALERMEQEEPKQVLVVCHMGIGMSRLLEAKLKQQYRDITIVDCIAKNELAAFLTKQHGLDFIITTVPLPPQSVPHIVISPLLDQDDKGKLQEFILGENIERSTTYPQLLYFLENGLFQKEIDLEHPFQVVERLAEQLVRLAVVEERFVHSALIRERTSFTSIGGRIAIPHAEPATVKKSTISMALLKEPMKWGEEVVSLVFLLAISEEDRRFTQVLLKEIAALSDDAVTIEKIVGAANKEAVETIFRRAGD